MNELKHTPGPWHIQDDHGTRWIETSGNDDTIAEIHRRKDKGSVYSCGEALANDRLIAAAPELLDSAKLALSIAESWILDQLDGTSHLESAMQSLDPVRAAIAKALGEE